MKKTALDRYQRLEAAALWRPAPGAQRLDVIVSLGEATLTITDIRDRVQAHWSLAAIARANPGAEPAIYHPDADPGETLEIAEGEDEMIAAIETLSSAIARQRPKPGRLRLARRGDKPAGGGAGDRALAAGGGAGPCAARRARGQAGRDRAGAARPCAAGDGAGLPHPGRVDALAALERGWPRRRGAPASWWCAAGCKRRCA